MTAVAIHEKTTPRVFLAQIARVALGTIAGAEFNVVAPMKAANGRGQLDEYAVFAVLRVVLLLAELERRVEQLDYLSGVLLLALVGAL